jgi:integrase/recombinase XerC
MKSFLSYLTHEKRYSTHTIEAYESDLKQAFAYFRAMYEVDRYQDVTHQLIRSWIVSLVSAGQGPRSVNRKMSSLRAYFKFLQRDGSITINPTTRLRALKLPKRLPQYLQEKQAEKLLLVDHGNQDQFAKVRDQFLIMTLYYTGLRRSELIELKDNDIDMDSLQMRVVGKGNKMRLIPLTPRYIKEYQSYLQKKREFFPDVAFLFLTGKGVKLYPKMVYNIVSKYLQAVSTVSQKGPHTLRHTFATHLSNHGADLNAIKDLLGHANLSATQIYTHNSIEKLKSAYAKAHPKAKL